MTDCIIELVSQLSTGEKTEKVYATVESVSQSEFFAASQAGYKAEKKVSMWISDYNEQSIVRLNGKPYSVYRKYERADQKVELYLTSKIGVH